MLTLLVLITNLLKSKRFIRTVFSKPIIIWGIWILYSSINLYVKGYEGNLPIIFFIGLNLLLPFTVMAVTAFEWTNNSIRISKLLLFTFLSYTILSFFVLTDFSAESRQFLGEMGNAGPLNTIFIILFSSILFAFKRIGKTSLAFLILYAIIILVLSASRKAFGAGMIMILLTLIAHLNLSYKRSFFITVLIAALYFGYDYTLNNTTLGERMSQIEERGESFNTTNIKALNLLGDRAYFYIEGWTVFINEPLTGIGLGNFMQESDSNYVIHSEYMVQLSEGGVIGTFLFLLFNFWIGIKLIKRLKNYPDGRTITLILLGGFLAILFVNITAWSFAFPQYFACFGIIIGYLRTERSSNKLKKTI